MSQLVLNVLCGEAACPGDPTGTIFGAERDGKRHSAIHGVPVAAVTLPRPICRGICSKFSWCEIDVAYRNASMDSGTPDFGLPEFLADAPKYFRAVPSRRKEEQPAEAAEHEQAAIETSFAYLLAEVDERFQGYIPPSNAETQSQNLAA